jgi:hypothetical protein
MMSDIKPIPTRYKGYHFRSRSEARFAVFCDHCSIRWQYEKDGFGLASGNYLPDFWIEAASSHVEIKPTSLFKDEIVKWRELVERSGMPLLVFNADFDAPHLWIMALNGHSVFTSDDGALGIMAAWLQGFIPDVLTAADAAKSARFEHGESGAT